MEKVKIRVRNGMPKASATAAGCQCCGDPRRPVVVTFIGVRKEISAECIPVSVNDSVFPSHVGKGSGDVYDEVVTEKVFG